MQTFNGFPPGKQRTTVVPNQFFSELLPIIDDLIELKVTLYCFWALQQQESEHRYVQLRSVLADELFVNGINADPAQAEDSIKAGFAGAVERSTLLHITVDGVSGSEDLYFMNTVRGRNAIQAIEAGRFEFGGQDCPVALVIERPNIFALYEQNIGPLTPMISEELREAEQDYAVTWIEEAIRLAVERNVRNWRYILGILKRWQTEGKDDGLSQQSSEADRSRYIQGEYSDFIDH